VTELHRFESPDVFQSNTFVLLAEGTMVVLDPGGAWPLAAALIDERRPKDLTLLATHGHIDHVSGIRELQERYHAPAYLHPHDHPLARNVAAMASMFGLTGVRPPSTLTELAEGELVLGPLTLEVLYTPGHSRGGVCLRYQDLLFTGDTLFHLSIGRTDLPGGDHGTLLRSIKTRLLPLQGISAVLPGHGPDTTLAFEREQNPFLNGEL